MKLATRVLFAIVFIAVSSSRVHAQGDAKPPRPNIILIMADDLGYGHLGCYGQTKIKTPNLDRMAKQGMRFTQFYAGSTVCAPSRSVLLQGLHSGHTGVRSNSGSASLTKNEVTLAEMLRSTGYATAGFGKWGLGVDGTPGVPYRQGFDHFWGFYHQVHAHFYYPYWIWHNDKKVTLNGNLNGGRGQYVDDFLHQKALEFIRRTAKKKQPFFCYIPSIIPHVELAVPEDSAKPYRGLFPKVTINDPRRGYIGSDHAYATYAGMISRLDRNVGDILALIRDLNIDENTIVIFTSDNGPQASAWRMLYEFFNGAGGLRAAKGSLHEGGLRVPFIARWPGKIKANSRTDLIGCFQDFMPTFAELSGAKCPKTDGVSLVPTLLGKSAKQKRHEYLYWEIGKQKAVRMGKWKAVKAGARGRWQLYDLSKDRAEENNVAKTHPKIVARITTLAVAAHTPPRPIIGSARLGIADVVQGPRLKLKNAR